MGICTDSLDGMKPSLTHQGSPAGLAKSLGHIPPGYNLCMTPRNVVASFARIAVVVGGYGNEDGFVGVAPVACSWGSSPTPVHSEARS